uniref:Ferritin n=1 Tax=Caenorhabditis tropicalis TaxID=1561998 RepID=A0A1I7U102_9PELO
MSQLRAMSLSNFQVEYLQNAYEALSNSRRTLMYSFAFAYYLKRDNNVMIFEDNLKDLEQATEQLSGMLEKKMLLNDLLQMKQPVQEKCQYVEKRRQVLLKHCSEGDAQDIWVFNQ